jgi:hypothetical protein
MTGRGFGRCRFGWARRESINPPGKTQEGGVPQEGQPVPQPRETGAQKPMYGAGRGGMPWGCGLGFCGGRRTRWWEKPEDAS